MTNPRKKTEKVDLDRAKLAPADEFARPADVADAPGISKRDKMKILAQWETDAGALSRAGDEGMTGGEPARLGEVEEARKKVEAAIPDTKPAKSGRKQSE